MAGVRDVAAAVLTRTGPITTMKLQKLLYYAQAWHLVFQRKPMFDEKIEAWPQGPVTPSIFAGHRKQYQVTSGPSGHAGALTAPENATLTWVMDKYAHYSAETLSRLTHMESPWRAARGIVDENEKSSQPIAHDQMRHFYARRSPMSTSRSPRPRPARPWKVSISTTTGNELSATSRPAPALPTTWSPKK